MKSSCILLLGLILAIPGAGFAAELSASDREAMKKVSRHHSRKVKGSRKIDLDQVRPSSGISSGCIVAYGHYIRPPYQIEYVGRRLMVNGVQVSPSIVVERERTQKGGGVDLQKAKGQNKVKDKIRNDYRSMRAAGKSTDEIRTAILAGLGKENEVKSATWKNEKTVMIHWKDGGPFPEAVTLREGTESVPKTTDKSSEAHQFVLDWVGRDLRDGKCVVFASDGRQGRAMDPRAQVNKIMKDSALPMDRRVQAISQAVGGEGAALDVIENYSEDEWIERK